MAERIYEIKISLDDNITGESPIAGDDKPSDTDKGKNKDKLKAKATALVAYGIVKSFATQIVNDRVSKVELRTGSRDLQERANFINGIAQKGLSFAENIGTGAFFGGGWGAAIGLAVSVAQTGLDLVQKQEELNLRRALENQSLQLNYIRAGASGSRRYE